MTFDASYWSGWVTIIGGPITIGALVVALWQLSLSKRSGSVTALVALHDALRECWTDYLTAPPEKRALAFGDLCNTIEIACAAFGDKVFFAESQRILESYLLRSLKLIEGNAMALQDFLDLLQEPATFINIRRFLKKRRKEFRALGAVSS